MNPQQTSYINNPSEIDSSTQSTNSPEGHPEKKKDSSVDHIKKLKQFIEQNNIEDLNTLLENEKIQPGTLTIGLCLALQLSGLSGNMLDIIDILLYHGANPDSQFRYVNKSANQSLKIEEKDNPTILMYGCLKGDIQLITKILRSKHNVNLKDKNGKNALFYALESRGDNVDVINCLIADGIEVNIEAKVDYGRGFVMHSPLSLAAKKNLKQCFISLLRNGADVNYKTSPDKDTVLHIAVTNENLDIIKEIIHKEGALLEEKNKKGKKPSEIAASLPKTEIYQVIIERIEQLKQTEIDNANELIVEMQKKKENKVNIIERELDDDEIIQTPIAPVVNNKKKQPSLIAQKKNIFPALKKNENKIKKLYRNPYKHMKFTNHSTSCLQIPISFTKTTKSNLSELSSYIDLSSINEPTLTIDLSQSQIENEMKLAQLAAELNEKNNLIAKLQNENIMLKGELERANYKLIETEKTFRDQENKSQLNFQMITEQLNIMKKENEELLAENNQFQKENMELKAKLTYLEQNSTSNSITPQNSNSLSQYLNKKFINFNYDHIYVLNCLSKDLIDYQQFVTEHIQREENIYNTLIQNLQNAANESIRDFDVHLYGSHATNLCLPWSDLDVVLIPRVPRQSTMNNPILLSQLYENISKQPWVKECKFIGGATIPIIKVVCIEQFNSMPIDISIQDERHFGLKCVDLVKTFITKYESLKPLVLALKNILKKANLNDPYKGGMSSYGLILMIVSFLQKQKKEGKDISLNDNNLGRLFYDFINFYGLHFDPSKYIIVAKSNDDENEDINFNGIQIGSDLMIIDPLNISNNVAKSCYQFCNIKMAFIICVITLKEDCECGCHYTGPGEEYNNLNIDHCFLKRIFNSVKRFQI